MANKRARTTRAITSPGFSFNSRSVNWVASSTLPLLSMVSSSHNCKLALDQGESAPGLFYGGVGKFLEAKEVTDGGGHDRRIRWAFSLKLPNHLFSVGLVPLAQHEAGQPQIRHRIVGGAVLIRDP